MTNFSKWNEYMSGVCSPQNYIDWGFYSMIAASLQRRVWLTDNRPVYPNMYVVLVGDPAVGKGLVIKPVAEIIHYHKLLSPADSALANKPNSEMTDVEKQVAEAVQLSDYKLAQQEESAFNITKDKNSSNYEKPLLIPLAADATTYEALVKAMSRCIRRKNFRGYCPEAKKEIMQIYTHSSLYSCLEELASLFRKRTEDLRNFLQQTYDCGDYTYDTKTQGKDRIRSCCFNILAGTTPDFMQETFDDKLLNQGFSSRTYYIYATKNRKNVGFIPSLTPEQEAYKKEIIAWIGKLADLYGQVHIDDETKKKFEDWWNSECNKPRNNTSLKLIAYYGRKNLHTMKLALAKHFGESLEMHIKWESFESAIEDLKIEERTMHYALALESDNPLAAPTRKIKEFLRINGAVTAEILEVEFWGKIRRAELHEILEHLQGTGQVIGDTKEDPIKRQQVMYYQLR